MSRTDDKLRARIRAALRSVEGDNGDDSDTGDLDTSHFGEVPFDALQSLAQRVDGNAGNGAPLSDLFDGMDEEAANRAALTLMSGLSQGPIAIANDLASILQITQNRAETIARNELIGSYRDAALANYNANSDVVGEWMWSAALGSACIVCTDMDGSLHPLDEDLVSHILCRCAMLPVTNSWDSILGPLGIDASDIPDSSITDTHQSGADWFAEQSAATQISILGPAKYNAWQSGDLSLSDLVGMRTDGAWGASMYERSLKDLGLDAQDYLPFSPSHFTGLGPQGREAVQGAREAIPAPEPGPIRVELPGGGYTYLDPYDIHQFDVGGNMDPAARAGGWQSIDDVMRGLRGQTTEGGPLELREPGAATATAVKTASYTQADLNGKTMAELRQIARDAGVVPARAKAETIDRILAKQQSAAITPAERVAALRREVDGRMAQREALYAQQNELIAEQDKLLNLKNPQYAQDRMERAERAAKIDLYHQSLDQSDPAVKQYLKDLTAYDKAQVDIQAARDEQTRLEQVMDTLNIQGKQGGAEYAQAKAEYDAAVKAQQKAEKASGRAWQNLWNKSPSVYKPELDSIGGFEYYINPIKGYTKDFRPVREALFTPQQIAGNRFVVEAKRELANLDQRIAEAKAQVQALDKPIKDINKQIDKDLAQLRDLNATLRDGAEAVDSLRPFSDVIELPEGHQPPNALMNKLDYKMREPRAVTKRRIIDDINTRLKDNPVWQDYVARTKMPDRLGVYHGYIDWHADAKDSKSAALVADWIKKWGVGYRPGSPQWVAMQMAAKDEFGLDAVIHTAAKNVAAGEQFYAENGDAVRALMRAMYDNTQQWFADNGITEIEVYRGFGWAEDADAVPKGINWGPADSPNYGVSDMELNPFQSFSADINVSQGTGAGNGFAGGGFGGGSDYSLLIGAKIPVERVLGTAQTGFGAKLESEIVVMGRATDTVAYRAGTRVESALLREADEQAVGAREMVYSLADGTAVRVAANADGTFTLTYQDGPAAKLGTLKVGSSKVYKTEKGVNKALQSMRFSNTYVAPAELAVREGESAAAAEGLGAAAADGLTARIDSIPVDATVADMQDWLKEQLPALSTVDLMSLDAPTARLVANASANLIQALPEVADNLVRIAAQDIRSDALAMVSPDGYSILLNTNRWTDLASLAERTPGYATDGWWVSQTPEQIIGHEIGHALQINYGISNDTWLAAMERVAAAGGNPVVSTYAGNKIEESFAETFALLVYGEPTDAQMAIAREMAQLLSDDGLDYQALRAAVGASPLDLS